MSAHSDRPLKGILLVNAFLGLEKFKILYERLKKAADKRDMELDIMTNAAPELILPGGIDEIVTDFDFCIFWDKDVRLGRCLERAGLRLFNEADAIALCDDKADTYLTLSAQYISQPLSVPLPFTYDNLGYEDVSFFDKTGELLGYPLVIKECCGSFGAQVYLAQDLSQAREILKKYGRRPLIAQRFIKEAAGRDLRLNMVGDKCVAAMMRINDNDFRANISNGGSGRAYEPTDEEVTLAKRCMEILHLDFAGVDILQSDEGPLLCEVNSNPQFVSTYECTGVDLGVEIMDHIMRELSS